MSREYLRRPALLSALEEIAYLERAATHLIAGWLPKIVALDAKLTLGRFQFASMDNASSLLKMLSSLSAPFGDWRASIPVGWRAYARAIDESPTAEAYLAGLFASLKVHVRDLAAEALRRTDPVLDQHPRERLKTVRADAEAQLDWYAGLGISTPVPRIDALWETRRSGDGMSLGEWMWAPIDRVGRPARPAHLVQMIPGSMSSRAILGTDEHTIETFHGSFDDELTTMELFGRCSYEHPDMPDEFHWAMARQTSDESRHAQSCLDVVASFGGKYGQHKIGVGIYTFHYQFSACEPGSKRELAWRFLLRSTLQEALSLDGFVLQIKKREFHGQPDVARVLESILADEIQHVKSGLRWATHLCGGDAEKAREELRLAHDYYVQHAERTRRKYVYEHPEEALDELEFVRNRDIVVPQAYPFDLSISVNHVARTAAGMTNEDIAQVVRWGYAYPSPPAKGP